MEDEKSAESASRNRDTLYLPRTVEGKFYEVLKKAGEEERGFFRYELTSRA